MKRAMAVIGVALVVLTPGISRAMATFGHSDVDLSKASSALDPASLRHDDAASEARTLLSGLQQRWSRSDTSMGVDPLTHHNTKAHWQPPHSTIDTATAYPADDNADDEQTPPTVFGLAEPATLAIWSFLGLLLGLRVWRRRRTDLAWGDQQDSAIRPAHRRAWSDKQRTAIHQLIERRRSRDPQT